MLLCVLFQTSWSQASKKQREKLLELIRRLAEDDKDGVMAHKVRLLYVYSLTFIFMIILQLLMYTVNILL